MNPPKFQVAAVCAIAATLLLSACGQAGPLYLPDRDSHKNKSLKRDQRAKATGTARVPASTGDDDDAAPATTPAVPQSSAPAAASPVVQPEQSPPAAQSPTPP
ncbi:MAG: hypothetical protein JWR16_2179 [Nevskia sp.]|nr:hypothetical protein [Nevskia sp.]